MTTNNHEFLHEINALAAQIPDLSRLDSTPFWNDDFDTGAFIEAICNQSEP